VAEPYQSSSKRSRSSRRGQCGQGRVQARELAALAERGRRRGRLALAAKTPDEKAIGPVRALLGEEQQLAVGAHRQRPVDAARGPRQFVDRPRLALALEQQQTIAQAVGEADEGAAAEGGEHRRVEPALPVEIQRAPVLVLEAAVGELVLGHVERERVRRDGLQEVEALALEVPGEVVRAQRGGQDLALGAAREIDEAHRGRRARVVVVVQAAAEAGDGVAAVRADREVEDGLAVRCQAARRLAEGQREEPGRRHVLLVADDDGQVALLLEASLA